MKSVKFRGKHPNNSTAAAVTATLPVAESRRGKNPTKATTTPATSTSKIAPNTNTNSASATTTRKEIGGAILIAIISIAVYWNSLDGDFVHDDLVAIVRNQDLRSTTPWTELWKNDYWGTPMGSHLSHKSYRPLTVLTFRANFGMNNGVSGFWFHVTNVWIHATVSSLVFFLCTRVLSMTLLTSLTASTIFAIHPIHTEAVAGITGRSDALACLLMLISFLLYSKSVGRDSLTNGFSWGIIGSGIAGCSALLAKETGITVLAINTCYDLYLHMDLVKSWLITKPEDQQQCKLRRRVTLMITLISISLALRLALMNGSFPRFSQQDNPAAHSTSDMTRFLTYAFLPVFNVWLMLCPYHLSYDWQIPLVETPWDLRNLSTGIFYPVSFWLLLQSFAKGKRRTQSGTIVFVAILFISLPFLPASNLLFPVGFVAAERVLYTPSIGVCILTAHGIDLLRRRFPAWRAVVVSSLCLMLMSFTVKTWDRNAVWKSRASLFESGLRENPGNAKVHYNYANLQKDLGHIEAAVNHYKIAISLWPEYASAHNNLGALYSTQHPTIAETCFLRAIHANPQHNGAHFNLAVIYMRSQKHEEALRHLEECLKLDPSHVEALRYLGACYNVLNKTHEAEKVFHKLISSDLPPSTLHTHFAHFLQELGRSSEALTHYLMALTQGSWNIQALLHGAKLASQLGSHQLFEELSKQLLSLKFDSGVAYKLAINYMEKGKLPEAKLLFERLVEESNPFYKIHYAQFLIDVRRWSEAEGVLKGISPTDSDHATSLLLLATVYENQNRTMEAFDTLQCALETFCPQEANLCAQFYSQLGNLMHTEGAFHSAAEYYDMAIKFNPDSVQAHSNIGAIYHLMREYNQAHSHYVAALEIEPENPVVLSNIQKLERVQQKPQGNDFSYAYR